MKKLNVLLLSGVVLAVAGCGNQGGSRDQYDTGYGTGSKTNYDQRSVTNDYQGSAMSPGRSDAGVIRSTNYLGLGTNNQFNTGSSAASNTNSDWGSLTNQNQGGARSPGSTNTGSGYSTNYPGLGTTNQNSAIDSSAQPSELIDLLRTNNAPEY